MDERIRCSLLESLFRYHNNIPVSIPTKLPEDMPNRFPKLPADTKRFILSSYLDYQSKILFGSVCNSERNFVLNDTRNRLYCFNPHFVTTDNIVNDILCKVITEHFSSFSKIELNDSFIDALEILIIKFFLDHLNFNVIPRNIYYYVLSFISEFVFGTNAIIPATNSELKVDLLRKFRFYRIPKSLDLIINSAGTNTIFPTSWIDNLKLFLSKLSIDTFDYKSVKKLSKIYEFRVILHEILLTSRLRSIMPVFSMIESSIFSPILFYEIYSSVDEEHLVYDFDMIIDSLSYRIEANKLLTKKFNRPHNLDNLLTRSSKEPFYIQDSPDISPLDLVKTFASSKSLSLAYLDIFSKFIQSDKFNSNDLGQFLNVIFCFSNVLLFEILVKEKKVPLKMFFTNEMKVLVDEMSSFPVFSFAAPAFIFENHQIPHFFSSFNELILSQDPLIFLTMSFKTLKQFQSFIVDSFDLNEIYNFDLSEEDMAKFNLKKDFFMRLSGEIISFKEIINRLEPELPELKMIFSSEPEIFDIKPNSKTLKIISRDTLLPF